MSIKLVNLSRNSVCQYLSLEYYLSVCECLYVYVAERQTTSAGLAEVPLKYRKSYLSTTLLSPHSTYLNVLRSRPPFQKKSLNTYFATEI